MFNFEISTEHFEKALDMFAQSFISAILSTDSTKREILAIESEFQLALMSDSSRQEEVMAELVHEGHFLRKFGWGNMKSLDTIPKKNKVDVMAALRSHYTSHYTPQNCKLVVLSSHDIAETERFVRQSFGGWRASALSHDTLPNAPRGFSPVFAQPFRSPARLCRQIPVKNNVHELSMVWTLPSSIAHYESRCEDYVGHLVGHEGSGSVLSLLQEMGLATDITAGVRGALVTD